MINKRKKFLVKYVYNQGTGTFDFADLYFLKNNFFVFNEKCGWFEYLLTLKDIERFFFSSYDS